MGRDVWLMSGPREQRATLPVESRREITVRPAYRPDLTPRSIFESLDCWAWSTIGWILWPFAVVLLATVVIAQVYIHFHPIQ